MKIVLKRTLIMVLMILMVITLVPNAGGSVKAYAADNELSGPVLASELTMMGEYALTGDAAIYIDTSVIISSIDVKGYTLTIEGNGEDILSVYGKGIKGYQGNVVLNSGSLDLDTSSDEGNWTYAMELTLGGFTMNGGSLFLNYYGSGRYSSYGINAKSFTMTGGTANVRCVTETIGSAVGIAVNDFTMTGGDMGVEASTTVSDESAYGIEANGATSDSDFHMSGGTLETIGTADYEGYGINWTGDRAKNNFVVDGGKLTSIGVKNGINSWVPVTIGEGAEVTAQSTNSAAIYADHVSISISGAGTKVTAESTNADAMDAYKGTIELVSGAQITQPENGQVATYGGDSQSIKNSSDEWAKKAVIEGLEIPTEIAITYDMTRAFPTTRLSGHDVSLHLLRNVTSNPSESKDGMGWYVYSAYPDMTDTEASSYTNLVKKDGNTYVKLNNSNEKLNTSDEYYYCFNIEDDGSRAFNTKKTYTATVNGQPADEVVQPNGGDDQLFVYKRVYLDELSDTVWSIKVHPNTDVKVAKGGSRQFTAEAYAATSDAVTWNVNGHMNSGTSIDSNGKLTVASGETSQWLTVTATSAVDNTVSYTVSVNVVDFVPTIESVSVTADRDPVCRGTGVQFNAVVEGTDIHDLTWELIGSDGASHFSGGSSTNRYLEVGQTETASELTVRATSVADSTKFGEATIRLKDKEKITGPINITFDGTKVSLTDGAGNFKTGKQVTMEFRNAVTSPYGQSLEEDSAPGGWFVYGEDKTYEPSGKYTSLVYRSGSGYNDNLYNSDETLSDDKEYYLWFNIEDTALTRYFDSNNGEPSALNITVNGMPVNGETVIAKWGGEVEVYMRIITEPGWIQVGDNWYYYETNTKFTTNRWLKKGSDWYYMGADGSMVKNAWKKDSKGWCYLGEDGKMVTNGWVKDSKGWCWIAADGYMPNVTKWIQYEGSWYHITNGSRDQSKWMKDSKGWCWLQADGRMLTNGWAKDSKGWCWIGSAGYMIEKTQWIKYEGEWYHITNGYRDESKWMKDSKGWCWLQEDGKMLTNGWAKDSKGYCWIGANGYMVMETKWIDVDGTRYYIKNGYMAVNCWAKDDTGWLYLGADGQPVTNLWKKDSKGWCYLGADGYMVTNDWAKDRKGMCWIGPDGYMDEETRLLEYGGDTYYIKDGYMQTNCSIEIGGVTYEFGEDGKLVP